MFNTSIKRMFITADVYSCKQFDAKVVIGGDKKTILENLVKQYEYLFGRASVEVCKDAVKNLLPKIPQYQRQQMLQ